MADDDIQELEIKIIPDEEANAEAAQAADEKVIAKKAEISTEVKDPAVQDLMAQYKELEGRQAETERRRIDAEQEAARHRTEAETAKKQVASSQVDTVTTALNAAKADAEQAKRDIRSAKDAGDIDAEIDAQDRLAQARADERRLDEAKSDLESRAKAPPKREAPQQTDPVEAYIQGRTAPTAQWLRAHPEFIRDPRKQAKLSAAHYDAEGEGLVADTPAYFDHVEKFLGIGIDKKAPIDAPQVKPRASAPVAPGSSVSNGGSGSGPVVTLTRGEALAATDGTHVWTYEDPTGKGRWKKGDVLGTQEFARRKLAMQKQGLYD
ncbi:hypothetical protein, partial [Candidatus Methylomirabilis sp.]|uniref:hypothetical protein n=1 Tax=Candidatus Methylomirabilis sp. TaxID=2032687 RepID=UPI003C784C90